MLNKVMIIGNLGRDPEQRSTSSGLAVTEFSVAVNSRRKNEDHTEWFNVKVFSSVGGSQAENAAKFLRKGRKVYIEGRLETRSWDDKDTGQKKYRTEIIASDWRMLDRAEGAGEGGSGGGEGGSSRRPAAPAPMGTAGGDEGDLPF